jgi:alanyl-tRNA synthetase
LQAALRQVLGSHVHQSGSLVTPERLRFDFTHYSAMSPAEREEVEAVVNAKIRENIPVTTFETSLDEARAQGVTALFGEKYDQQVRVVQLADTSQELCGGTHVEASGEIGLFMILSEGGIAAGVRRIEAVTGEGAYVMVRRDRETLRGLAERLKTNPDQLFERVDKLLADRANLEKRLKNAAAHSATTHLDDILAEAEDVEGLRVVAAQVEAEGREALLNAADSLRKKLRDGVGVLGAASEGGLLLVAVVGEETLKKSGLRAGDIIREVAAVVGGKGGGKPHLAQGGGKDPARLPEALAAVTSTVRKLLKKDEG